MKKHVQLSKPARISLQSGKLQFQKHGGGDAKQQKRTAVRYNFQMMKSNLDPDFIIRDSLVDSIFQELREFERCCFYQRVFVFSKNILSTQMRMTSSVALHTQRGSMNESDSQDSGVGSYHTEMRPLAPSVSFKFKDNDEEGFFALLQERIDAIQVEMNAKSLSEDHLSGLVMVSGQYTLFVIEGPDGQVVQFFHGVLSNLNKLFAEHRVLCVENRINETYFKDFVYRYSKPIHLNEKFPPTILKDAELLGKEHLQLVTKLRLLCEAISNRLYPRTTLRLPSTFITTEPKEELQKKIKKPKTKIIRKKVRKPKPPKDAEQKKKIMKEITKPISSLYSAGEEDEADEEEEEEAEEEEEYNEGEKKEQKEIETQVQQYHKEMALHRKEQQHRNGYGYDDDGEEIFQVEDYEELSDLVEHGSEDAFSYDSSSDPYSSGSYDDLMVDFDRTPYANLMTTSQRTLSLSKKLSFSNAKLMVETHRSSDEESIERAQSQLVLSQNLEESTSSLLSDEQQLPEAASVESHFKTDTLTEYPSNFLPHYVYQKMLPEVQRIKLIFGANRFYVSLKKFLRYHEELPDYLTSDLPKIWPTPWSYLPLNICKHLEFDANNTLRQYRLTETKREPERERDEDDEGLETTNKENADEDDE